MSAEPYIAIAGGGLAGLCLAQSLLRAGIDAQVYERDPSPHARRQGYRITVDQHGTAALKSCLPLKLFEAVLASASAHGEVGYFRFTNQHLGEIFKLTFAHAPNKIHQKIIGQVDRAILRSIMLSGLEDRVHYGKEVRRVETMQDGAVLCFLDGTFVRASMVVGADGTHSALRTQLLPDCPIIDTGGRGIYGKTPLMKNKDQLVPSSLENSGVWSMGDAPGRGFFFTTMRFNEPPRNVFAQLVPNQEPPITDDYVMWGILLPNQDCPANVQELGPDALYDIALDAVRGYHPVLQRFVQRADADYTLATSLFAATRPKAWPASRATLIGDAVHVMPPTGAHGGNTALRDAALLAEKLEKATVNDEPLQKAIAAYQSEMIEYSFKEVDASRKLLACSNMKNPLVRFAMLRAIPWLRSVTNVSPKIE